MEPFTIALIAQSVIFGGATAIVANSKGRDGLGWFILGAVFSLVALIVVAALPAVASAPRAKKSATKHEFPANPQDPERPWLG